MPLAGAAVEPESPAAPPARAPAGSGVDGEFARLLLDAVLVMHRDLSVDQAALTAVNEARGLLSCDRAALAVRRGRRTELVAVSGQERITTRSNLVRAMTELARALGDAGKPFRFDGDFDLLPASLRPAVVEYFNQSGARSVEAIPLCLRGPSEDDGERAAPPTVQGWLLCEQFGEAELAPDERRRQAFAEHVAVALANADAHRRQSTPLRRAVRRFFAPSEAPSARQALRTAALLAVAVVVLGALPVRRRVEALGRLTPVRRCEVFAPARGRVKEVLVDGNQSVVAGQVLVRLANERLDSEVLATRHLLEQKQQMLTALEAQSAEAKRRQSDPDAIRLSGAVAQTKIEIVGTQHRLRSLEAEAAELEIRAPIAGEVATFDPRHRLLNRPVERGEPLLEIMDGSGPWELELALPAKRVGPVLQAQTANPAAPLGVQFTLATEPEATYDGALRTPASRIETTDAAEAVAPLKAQVAIEQIARPVAGADVIARIDCGPCAFARVVFGDVLDFVRSRVW